MNINFGFINDVLLLIAGHLFTLLAITTIFSLRKGVGLFDLMKRGSRVNADLERYFRTEMIRPLLFITYAAASVFLTGILMLLVRLIFLRQ